MNPVTGKYSIDKKKDLLGKISDILSDCVVEGLDTKSKEEFCESAQNLSQKVDTLVVCGGDGTFLDIVNSVEDSVTLAYLPFGSGNALKTALGYPSKMLKITEQIKDGYEHKLDLLSCDGKKAFLSSVGIEGCIIKKRDKNLEKGKKGLSAYTSAAVKSFLDNSKRTNALVDIDGKSFEINKMLSLIVTKIPFYGYGLNMVPKAKFDDGKLHFLSFDSITWDIPFFLLSTVFLGRNSAGSYKTGKKISIVTEEDVDLQINGDYKRRGKHFNFEILPDCLKLKY